MSVAAKELGANTVAAIFPAGEIGARCKKYLDGKVEYISVELPGQTREGLVCIDEKTGKETTFLGADIPVGEDAFEKMAQLLEDKIRPGDIFAFCGSFPGWKSRYADRLSGICKSKNARICVDTYGAPLEDFAKTNADLLKINRAEFLALLKSAAIPFGGKSITNDIDTECKIFSETLAENIKLAHGICMPEKLQNMNEKILRINIGTTAQYKDLPVKYLSEVITCRVQEIMEAILYEIQKSGFADRLLSGVVLTGGGANLANCGNFITELSGYSVRIGYPKPMFSGGGCIGVHEAEAATVIGMILAAAKDSCGDCSVVEELQEFRIHVHR